MLKQILWLALIGVAGQATASAERLRAEAEAFAGQPVRLDPRISVPDCPGGFGFRAIQETDSSLTAYCPASNWQMRLALPAAGPAAVSQIASRDFALPRRGQMVKVEIEGDGYRIAVDALVESVNQKDGSLSLRNPRSGTVFQAQMAADGRIVPATQ